MASAASCPVHLQLTHQPHSEHTGQKQRGKLVRLKREGRGRGQGKQHKGVQEEEGRGEREESRTEERRRGESV